MILSILSYLVIPFYTLLFVRETDLFSSNFSVIGSLEEQKNRFSVWAILLSTTLYRMLFPVIGKAPFSPPPVQAQKSQPQNALFFSFKPGALFSGCYRHSSIHAFRPSLQARMHVFCALISSVSLFTCLVLLIHSYYRAQLGPFPEPDVDSMGFFCRQHGSSACLRDRKQRSGNSGNHYRLRVKPPALPESF